MQEQDEGNYIAAIYCNAVHRLQCISTGRNDHERTVNQLLCDSYIQPGQHHWIRAFVPYPRKRRYYIHLSYLHARTCVYIARLVYPRITSRNCMQSYANCSIFSTTIAGTCIMANLPRCLPSTMQNGATVMNVTLPEESEAEHVVQFAATTCEPGKLFS